MAKDSVSQIKKLRAEARVLLDEHGIAAVDEARLHPFKRFIHFWVLVGKSFARNRCPVRASALAYTTLLALVPLLAVGLGVSTKLLQSSEEQKTEMIQTLVDELAPQLGLVPVSVEEEAEVRSKVVEKIQGALPALLQSSPALRADLIDHLAADLADLVPPREAVLPGKAEKNAEYQRKLARRIQE